MTLRHDTVLPAPAAAASSEPAPVAAAARIRYDARAEDSHDIDSPAPMNKITRNDPARARGCRLARPRAWHCNCLRAARAPMDARALAPTASAPASASWHHAIQHHSRSQPPQLPPTTTTPHPRPTPPPTTPRVVRVPHPHMIICVIIHHRVTHTQHIAPTNVRYATRYGQ